MNRRFEVGSALAALSASVMLACATDRLPEPATTVFTFSTPTWFEETGGNFQIAPNERQALYSTRGRGRVIDLATAKADTVPWTLGLEQVRAGTFNHSGALVRRGNLNGQTGWFVNDGVTPKPLAVPPTVFPRWSPDGSALAYFAPGDTTIALGAPDKLRTVSLGNHVTGLAWSAGNDAVFALVLDPHDGISSLLRIPMQGPVETIRQRLDAAPGFNSLAPTRNGRSIYLALASDTVPDMKVRHDPQADRDLDIYQLNLKSGQLRPIASEPRDDCCPVIAGANLYWTHNQPTAEVVVIPMAGGEPRAVASDGFLPRFSPDGKRIAFTRAYYRMADYGLDMDGWVVDVDPAAATAPTPRPLIAGFGEDMGPAWSPDGKWIAYHSHRSPHPVPLYDSEGRTDDLWIRLANSDSAPEIQLTDFGWEEGPPDWAPDGRRMVFDSWEKGGPPGVGKPWIATIDPATGRPISVKRIPLPEGVQSVLFEAWSPVRSEIAMVERIDGARQAIWITSPEGKGARKVVEFACLTYGGVDWTPSGDELVYGALAGDTMQIFAVSRAGGPPRQITHGAVSVFHPAVSADGKWLAASRIKWSKELRRAKL